MEFTFLEEDLSTCHWSGYLAYHVFEEKWIREDATRVAYSRHLSRAQEQDICHKVE
jgi:hypothetical protein